MSWLFSQALVVGFSAASCSDGEPSALSSGSPTPQAYLSPDKTTAFSRLSRYGMTLGHLTASRGEELLTLFRAAFPVKTYPSPAVVPGSTESAAECGGKWSAWWTRYDPDTSTWRTRQRSLVGGWEEFSETWPRSGSMRNGRCYLRQKSGPGTSESESGSWLPTIGKNEFKGAGKLRYRGSPQFRGAKMSEGLRTCATDPIYLHPSFAEYAMGWPHTWTELAPLGMDKFQLWQQQHGAS
jgi:hypothetical protein